MSITLEQQNELMNFAAAAIRSTDYWDYSNWDGWIADGDLTEEKWEWLRAKRRNIDFPKFYGPYICKDGFERFVILYSENNRKTYTRKTLPPCWNWQTEGS